MPKFYDKVDVLKKPGWLKIRLHRTPEYAEVQQIVDKHALHTICSSGMCPNKAECWSRRTATFMILGDICPRGCRFCATKTGHPLAPDAEEPRRVAESVALMKLRYVVVTSVTRDDLPDGGAAHWAQTVRAIRTQNPDAVIELRRTARPAGRGRRVEARYNRAQHRNRRAADPGGAFQGKVPYEPGNPALPQCTGRRNEKRTDGRTWRER